MSTPDPTPFAAALSPERRKTAVVELEPFCQTCDGNGSSEKPFDRNCPAEWAHKYVNSSRWSRYV